MSMWTKRKTDPAKRRLRDYDREMLRAMFVSLFWAVIQERRKLGKFTLQGIADAVGTNKSAVSRWFSGENPNWQLNTIADIAGALDLEIRVEAIDRKTGQLITPSGVQSAQNSSKTETPAGLTTASPNGSRIEIVTNAPQTSARKWA